MGSSRFFVIGLCSALLLSLSSPSHSQSSGPELHDEFCSQSLNAYGPAYALQLRQRTRDLVDHLEDLGLCEAFHLQEVWRENHHEMLVGRMVTRFGWMDQVFYDAPFADEQMSGLMSFFVSGQIQDHYRQAFLVNQRGLLDRIRSRFGVIKAFALARVHYPQRPLLSQVTHINTHLHHSSQDIRLTQLLQMAAEFLDRESFGQPWLASGDFNFSPESLEWYLMTSVFGFKDSFVEAYNNPEDPDPCTYCRDNPMSWDPFRSRRIDYIFYRSGSQIELAATQARVIFNQEPLVSDHYGVEADFNLTATHSYLEQRDSAPTAQDFAHQIYILQTTLERIQNSRVRGVRRFSASVEDLLERFQNPSLEDPLLAFLWQQPGGLLPGPTHIDFVEDFFMGEFVNEEQL